MRKFLGAIAALSLAACNPVEQTNDADALSEVFHQDFSQGNFEKIWSDASDEFRANTPRNKFDIAFNNLHRFYGEYQGGTREEVNLNTNNGVTITEITMKTTYANSRAHETFQFIGTGDNMALLHWEIDPEESGTAGDAAEAGGGQANEAQTFKPDESVANKPAQ